MSKRFLEAGFRVVGFDLQEGHLHRLEATGVVAAASADAVFSRCDSVVLSLPNSDAAQDVLAVLKRDDACRLVIDTTTGSPTEVEKLSATAATAGACYLDATVSGSSTQVEAGKVTVMAGGDAEAFAQCEDIFSAFAREAFHTGKAGSGARMKLVTNLILGLNRAALAEGLHLAEVLGIAPDVLKGVLPRTMAHSAIMDTKLGKMLSADFSPQARLRQHLKDVRLMLEQAKTNGTSLPLSETHALLLETAETLGFGDADNSAVLKAYTGQPPSDPTD